MCVCVYVRALLCVSMDVCGFGCGLGVDVWVGVCLPVYMSHCLSVCMYVLYVFLSICLPVYFLSVCLLVCMSVCLSMRFTVGMCLSIGNKTDGTQMSSDGFRANTLGKRASARPHEAGY